MSVKGLKNVSRTKFYQIRQKGIFSYSYVSCIERLSEKKLPIINFFTILYVKKNISIIHYKRAQEMRKLFECKTLDESSYLYFKSDILLLSDIFENFSDVVLKTDKLESAHHYTNPSLSVTCFERLIFNGTF